MKTITITLGDVDAEWLGKICAKYSKEKIITPERYGEMVAEAMDTAWGDDDTYYQLHPDSTDGDDEDYRREAAREYWQECRDQVASINRQRGGI